MKMKTSFFVVLAVLLFAVLCNNTRPRLIGADDKILEIEVLSCNDSVINQTTPGTKDNIYGFEGGRVVKVGDTCHLITACKDTGHPRFAPVSKASLKITFLDK